ncbi:MAG: hypothetical protein VR73_10250 [Gammaproteobacteria bacterium BRH_c0]|nr:MAG: hypothetical protein VR73_10250 [Gammaproteobacteria bacterium BRH_c0]
MTHDIVPANQLSHAKPQTRSTIEGRGNIALEYPSIQPPEDEIQVREDQAIYQVCVDLLKKGRRR